VRATARAAANRDGWNADPRPPDLSHNAPRVGEVRAPQKRLRF